MLGLSMMIARAAIKDCGAHWSSIITPTGRLGVLHRRHGELPKRPVSRRYWEIFESCPLKMRADE